MSTDDEYHSGTSSPGVLISLNPQRRLAMISEFGRVLMRRTLPVSPESALPFSREFLEQAIFEELCEAHDDERRGQIEALFAAIESFLPQDQYEIVERCEMTARKCEAAAGAGDWATVNSLNGALEKDREKYGQIEKNLLARYQHQSDLLRRKLAEHSQAKPGFTIPGKGFTAEVVTYRDDQTHCFSQLKLADGSRILVSIGSGEIAVFKLILGGTVPSGTIWKAKGPNDIRGLFKTDADFGERPLKLIVDMLRHCGTIDEARTKLNSLHVE